MIKNPPGPAIRKPAPGTSDSNTEVRRQEILLKTGALQSAIFNSANFSSIATDAKGVIQLFNVGAERMLGYTAAEVITARMQAEKALLKAGALQSAIFSITDSRADPTPWPQRSGNTAKDRV